MSKQKCDGQFSPVTVKEILRSELKFHLEFHLGIAIIVVALTFFVIDNFSWSLWALVPIAFWLILIGLILLTRRYLDKTQAAADEQQENKPIAELKGKLPQQSDRWYDRYLSGIFLCGTAIWLYDHNQSWIWAAAVVYALFLMREVVLLIVFLTGSLWALDYVLDAAKTMPVPAAIIIGSIIIALAVNNRK